jgi:ankyrin repeat protein
MLLDAGALIDAVDAAGFRPIHFAYWRNAYWAIKGVDEDPALAEILRTRGARDTITLAAARGDEAAVSGFLARDRASANHGDTLEKRPLSTAVERGHAAIARLLIEHGADPNLREGANCGRGFALWSASSRDDVALARLLLDHGADPNAGVDSCGTPSVAAKSARMRALMYENGGKPPVFWDYVYEGDLRTVAAVLAHTDDPFKGADEWCGNPFTAIVCGCFWTEHRKKEPTDAHWAMLRMFLKRGFRVPPVLTSCRSYLYYTPAMTRLLLEHGMNPNLPNWQRQTPLHEFAGAVLGHIDDAKRLELSALFLEFGADLHARDEEYRSTPLAWAARAGRKDMVEFLLARGAKVELPDDEPWATPLAWARRRGHAEIAALLEARGARR